MKPAAFEYHRPDTAGDAVAMLAQLGDGAKVLAGGQSLVPMLALRLTMFEHLIDITRIAELQGIERDERDGADRGRHHRGRHRDEQRGGGHGAAAGPGDPVDRALPDPQPRHDRRVDRARRSRRRVSGGRPRARCDARGARHRRRSARPRHGLLHRVVGHRDRRRRAARPPSRSRSGRADAGSRSRRWPGATATSPSPAPPWRSRSTSADIVVRCGIGLFGLALDAGAGRRRSRPRSSAATSTSSTPTSSASRRSATWTMCRATCTRPRRTAGESVR